MTLDNHTFTPTSGNKGALRRALGCYGTGVTVITATTAHGPLGMTANSFSSVSLDPALILWSPAINSKRHDTFVATHQFCVHVLGADQLALAKHFATNGSGFDLFEWAPGPNDVPTLAGCLAEFHCETHAVYPAGDHSLILGLVRHVSHHAGDRPGLLFNKGQFGCFTAEIPDDQ